MNFVNIKRARCPIFVLFFCVLFSVGQVGGNAYASEPSLWASAEIEEAIKLHAVTEGLIEDYQSSLTRDALIELLMKTYESVTDEVVDVATVKNPFKDTNQIHILKAYSAGIARGITPTAFSPEAPVTREQMVVMLVRMLEAVEDKKGIVILSTLPATTDFADDGVIAPYAKEAVYKAFANGIISGDEENQLNPKGLSTCEQALVINYRLLNQMAGADEDNATWQLNLLEYDEEVTVVAERNLGVYDAYDQKAFVIADVLNMRSEPILGDEKNIIRRLQAYEEVVIIESREDWYKIVATGEMIGYVHKDYLQVYNPDDTTDSLRMQIVAYAKQYIGTPYRYGGNSLDGGIDCSAFTKQVVRPFGYVLERSSRDQGRDGVAISEGELQPGDLVFYGYNGSISHVALYIGKGEVIHATTSYGVKVTDMKGYLYKPVIAYRRVVF